MKYEIHIPNGVVPLFHRFSHFPCSIKFACIHCGYIFTVEAVDLGHFWVECPECFQDALFNVTEIKEDKKGGKE